MKSCSNELELLAEATQADSDTEAAYAAAVAQLSTVLASMAAIPAEPTAELHPEPPTGCPFHPGQSGDATPPAWPPRHAGSTYTPTAEAAAHYKNLIAIYNPLGRLAAGAVLEAASDTEVMNRTAAEPAAHMAYFGKMPLHAGETLPGGEESGTLLRRVAHHMEANSGECKDIHASHGYSSFIYSIARTSTDTLPVSDIVITPVGDYGVSFARRLNAVGRLGSETIFGAPDVQAASDDAWQAHRDVLRLTARGREGQKPVRATQEGWLSAVQVAAHLTGQKVAGYEDGDALLDDVIKEGLIMRVTRLVPQGIIGPLTMGGKFYADPLYVNEAGKLDLQPAFEAQLAAAYNAYISRNRYALEHGLFEAVGTGIICPVAGKGGALVTLSDALNQTNKALKQVM